MRRENERAREKVIGEVEKAEVLRFVRTWHPGHKFEGTQYPDGSQGSQVKIISTARGTIVSKHCNKPKKEREK